MEGDELLKCNVCLSGFDSNIHKPLLLPKCGHTFCRFCLDTLHKQSKSSCPECRKQDAVVSVELLPTNFSLLALVESMTQSDPGLSTRPKTHKIHGSSTRGADFQSDVSEALSATRPTTAPVHPVATPRNLVNLGARPRQNPGQAYQSLLSRKHKAQHPSPSFMQQATNVNSHQQATWRNGLNQPDFCNDKNEAVRLQEELDFQMAIHLTFCKVLISSMGPCFSLVYSRLLLSFGSSSTTVAWIFNTFSLVWNVMGPVVGPLTAECGHRKVAVTGALLCSLALILSAFSSSAWMLLLTFSLIGGVGAGLVVGASVLILPLYFSRRRGFANGLFMAGTSVGLFIAPHLITYLQDLYTFKGATLILGAIVLNGCAAGSTYHPISWHMQHQRKSSSNITEESQRKPLTKTINKNNPLGTSELLNGKHQIDKDAPRRRCFVTRVVISTVRDLGILQSSRALIIALTSTLVMNGYLNFIMMVPFIVTKGKHTPYDAAWCVSVSGISNLLTRVIVSALADCSWFHLRACYMAGILLIALSSLAFSFIPNLAWMTVTMAVWGCGVGAFMGLYNLIMIRYMGMKKLPSMYGASSLLNGLGFITIGPLIGYIRDLSGSYQVSLWVLVVTEALCVFLWFLMPAAAARDNRKALEREQGGLQ